MELIFLSGRQDCEDELADGNAHISITHLAFWRQGKARQCYPGSDGRKLMNQSYDEFGGRSALRWRLAWERGRCLIWHGCRDVEGDRPGMNDVIDNYRLMWVY